ALEERLDVVLFERTKTGLEPTAEAEVLLPRAVSALTEIDLALEEIRGSSAVESLSVGTTPELLMLVAPAARDLMTGTGGLGHLEASTADDLIAGLRGDAIDVVILPALGDQIPEWAYSTPLRTIRVALHQPAEGARSEILALPPEGSWERALLRGLMGHDPSGPTFEATGGGVSKRLLREGFSVFLPVGCADDVANVELLDPIREVTVYAITRHAVLPESPAARLIDRVKETAAQAP
ncbi:MAG: LysR family transcriptional regulator, partial [Actinomycetota bacterium]|nr:LysR family transcriptional regulator [Actinomycetota bacterium]